MHLFFLRSYICDASGIGCLATFWHGGPWDEVDGVGAALAVVLDTKVK